MLGVVGDRAHVLIARGEIDAAEALGVRDRACLAQLLPDRIRVLDPARIEMIEIGAPVVHRRARAHVSSSMTSIASSGQFALASQAFSASAGATLPSPTSCALPRSSSLKSSGASAAQRACPWQRSGSTLTFSLVDRHAS